MSDRSIKSQTMRIDLIPDIPVESQGHRRIRVVKGVGRTGGGRKSHSVASNRDVEKMDRYHELLNAIYDAAVITDINGIISEVNERAIEFLQWSAEELGGASIIDIISGADEDLIDMLVNNLKSERHTLIQAYCLRRDGGMFPAEIAVNHIKSIDGALCFFIRDITVRRQAEEMLITEHNAIQNSANGIAVAGLDGCFEYVNPAFVRMLGYSDSCELVGKDVREVLGGGELAGEMVEKVITQGSTWKGEMRVELPAGNSIDLGVLAACNRNSNGDVVGIVFSFADLTDRNRAEEAIRKAEQQRVMLESLGAACHHLGQPATVLSVSVGGIRSHLESDNALVNELVDKSVKASEQLAKVLHKLNEVNVYRTTAYLKDDSDIPSSRIIDI